MGGEVEEGEGEDFLNNKAPIFVTEEDEWRRIFDQFDSEGYGDIDLADFERKLSEGQALVWLSPAKSSLLHHKIRQLSDCGVKSMTFANFVNMMTRKRTLSFKCAIHSRDRQIRTAAGDYYNQTAESIPQGCKKAKIVFVPLAALIQTTVFILAKTRTVDPLFFNFNPGENLEVYRYLSYCFMHTSPSQFAFNLSFLLILGTLMELQHGTVKVSLIWSAGVISGSTMSTIWDTEATILQGKHFLLLFSTARTTAKR